MSSADADIDLFSAIGASPELGDEELDEEGAGEAEGEDVKKSEGEEAKGQSVSHRTSAGTGDEAEEEENKLEGEEEDEEGVIVRPRIPVRPGVCARYAVPSFDPNLDVFLMVCRKKTTIFIDAKEDTTVLELKRMIAGITKMLPEDQKLYRDQQELDDRKKLCDYGLTSGAARPQLPAMISLVFKDPNGEWEGVDIVPLSQPPELPEVMRQQEPTGVGDAA